MIGLTVTDIADALMLKRLFEVLWPRGIVVVATSNSVPDQLYQNGLNRQLVSTFLSLIYRLESCLRTPPAFLLDTLRHFCLESFRIIASFLEFVTTKLPNFEDYVELTLSYAWQFLPFIHQLKEYCDIHNLNSVDGIDYRRRHAWSGHFYHCPLDDNVDGIMDHMFLKLSGEIL